MQQQPQASAAPPPQSWSQDRWRGRRTASTPSTASRPAPPRCPPPPPQSPAQFLALTPASELAPAARQAPTESRFPAFDAKPHTKAVHTTPRTPAPTPANQRSQPTARPAAPETATGRFAPIPFSRHRAANSCSLAPPLRVSREEALV